jgi:VanZ family protein
LIVSATLIAGLWPFHAPPNRVHWLENENGLRFDRYGTVLSSNQLAVAGSDGPSCSLEVWLEPVSAWKTGTVLAFYKPWNHQQFTLQQHYTDLALQRDLGDVNQQSDLSVDDVFRRKRVLITVTTDGLDTAVYTDGRLATWSSRFGLSLSDLAGTLIAATSPLQSNNWPGQLRGLAIYKSALTADQVAQHYLDWTQKGRPGIVGTEHPLALYLFDERAGKIVHDQIEPGSDLHIPDHYVVVHQTILEPPWKEFRRQKNYLPNALLNIGGFVPLGFSVYACLSLGGKLRRPAMATIIVGAMVSLTIEVLQSYLPTRDSGMTDLFTNVIGTSFGVLLCQAASGSLARAGRNLGG